MAPEIMEDLPYNEKVDVYSYGIVLCELLSRQHPFADTYHPTCYQVCFLFMFSCSVRTCLQML